MALIAFKQTYNQTWIIERHGYRHPRTSEPIRSAGCRWPRKRSSVSQLWTGTPATLRACREHDRFVFDDFDTLYGSARDVIVDFTPAEGDRIDLSLIDANWYVTGTKPSPSTAPTRPRLST